MEVSLLGVAQSLKVVAPPHPLATAIPGDFDEYGFWDILKHQINSRSLELGLQYVVRYPVCSSKVGISKLLGKLSRYFVDEPDCVVGEKA